MIALQISTASSKALKTNTTSSPAGRLDQVERRLTEVEAKLEQPPGR